MSIKKFNKDFEVHYYEINKFREATPVTLLNYLEEAATSHSSFVGYDMDKLKSDGIGWVLNRWVLNIERYPYWNESIVVETWPSSFERFYATREFYIKDSSGIVIGKATSLWIFINLEKRKPIRIPENFGEVYGVNFLKAVTEPYREIRILGEPEVRKEFAVRQLDIDTNDHVNNSKYVEWMLEAIPEKVYNSYMMSSLEIEYKKETRYGEKIISNCKDIIENEAFPEYIHSVQGKDDKGELAVARTLWKKRI